MLVACMSLRMSISPSPTDFFITPAQLADFQRLYEAAYRQTISDGEALPLAANLITLYHLLVVSTDDG